MSLYEGQKCPVCGAAFSAGDDVVTCPECGTPHHRACYEKNGRCANAALHSQGFDYKKSLGGERVSDARDENAQSRQSGQQQGEYYVPPAGTQQGAAADSGSSFSGAGVQSGGFVFKNDERLGGFLLADVATVIGANFMRFIERFKKNRALGWNWSALVFGPYYLFLRKMYGPGSLFLALEFAARFIISMVFSKQLSALASGLQAILQNEAATYEQYYAEISQLMESTGSVTAYLVLAAVIAAIHIVIALTADRIYKNKVFSVIRDVDKRLEEGQGISVPVIALRPEAELSQPELRRLMLAGKGGVSFFAPCIAFLALSVVTDIIAYL